MGSEDETAAVSYLLADPDRCAKLAQEKGVSPVVLEWIDCIGGLTGILTGFADGKASCHQIQFSAEVSLFDISEQVGRRLNGWRVSRKGEPFEVQEWRLLQQWLHELIDIHAPQAQHLIVIDHAELSAIPFHIALHGKLTVSYEADWSGVATALRGIGQAPRHGMMGVACVPRANESVEIRQAMHASARAASSRPGWQLDIRIDNEVDATTLTDLIRRSDLVKILCHGQISRKQADVGLWIAYNRYLPPGNTLLESDEAMRNHRFGWVEASAVQAAAKVVFLGACSGGRVAVRGMDERISLSAALRHAGTLAMVSARWRIDIPAALPILDEIVGRFLAGEDLADAISAAATAAIERGVPRWQACAFVTEGSWK